MTTIRLTLDVDVSEDGVKNFKDRYPEFYDDTRDYDAATILRMEADCVWGSEGLLGDGEPPVRVVERDDLVDALRPFAESNRDLTPLNCHSGLVSVEECGRCSRVLEARRVLALEEGT